MKNLPSLGGFAGNSLAIVEFSPNLAGATANVEH